MLNWGVPYQRRSRVLGILRCAWIHEMSSVVDETGIDTASAGKVGCRDGQCLVPSQVQVAWSCWEGGTQGAFPTAVFPWSKTLAYGVQRQL